jgi:hypothetical protein
MQVALIRINKRWESEYVKLVMKWTGLLTRMNYVLTEVHNIEDVDIKFSAYDFMFRLNSWYAIKSSLWENFSFVSSGGV